MLSDRKDDNLAIIVIDVEDDAPNVTAICDVCGAGAVELAVTLLRELVGVGL
jgi:hypothetical protein